ncbi:MAG TPA: NUDIX hydrolase [Burkholderiales bacterium]|nr:NUDIX hydrolase [Burkholderiales bacterium]
MSSPPDFTEHPLASKCVYQGRLLHIREDVVGLPDGGQAFREYVVHPGAVMIIALTDTGKLVLERQFRYPIGQHMYELPAGKIDPGEDALATAKRELLEETGFVAADWRELTTVYPLVAYSSEAIRVYLARGLRYEGRRLDPGEFLETLEMALEDALDWVRAGRISDGKTVMGLLWAERVLRNGW